LHAITAKLADINRFVTPSLVQFVATVIYSVLPSRSVVPYGVCPCFVRPSLSFRPNSVIVRSFVWFHPSGPFHLLTFVHRRLFVIVHPRQRTIFFKPYVVLKLCWRAPKSRGETHLRVPQSQIAESLDSEARSRLPTLERGRGSNWEPRD